MKIQKRLLPGILFLFIVLICGCQSSTPDQGSMDSSSVLTPEQSSFNENDDLDYVYQILGDTLVVQLDSNQTTGCSWESSELVSLEETESFYTPDEGSIEQVGVGGIETHAFRVLQPGNASVRLVYGQHWEGGSTYEIYNVTVTVDEEMNITDVLFENESNPNQNNEWNYAQEHPQEENSLQKSAE